MHTDNLASLTDRAPVGSVFNAVVEAIPLCEAVQAVAQVTVIAGGAVSTHLTTNAWVIEQFGPVRVTVDEVDKVVAIAI